MITGVVLARNEEANIVDCLGALRPHVDEILLIDMESEDRTVPLAEPLVEQVLRHPLTPNFDAARNMAIDVARYDWMWFCDADERIPAQVGQTVRQIVREQGGQFEALYIPFKSYFCGKWIEHCGWWPGYTMPRVLKKGRFRFREQLHSGVEVDGREVRLPPEPANGVDHYSYLSVEHYFEKFNRYTSTEAQHLAAGGEHWDWRAATRAMVRDLWMYYERNEGHKDGAHGWILSWLGGQYRWASRAKLIDQNGSAVADSFPKNLDEFIAEITEEVGRLRSPELKPPLGVLWRSPIYDPSGYADEGRCFAKALARGERRLALSPINWSDRLCELPPIDRSLFRALEAAQKPTQYIAVTSCIPSLVEPDPAAAVNVLRTTFETDRIPESWTPRLDAFDEIWVMSEHNRDAFVRSGVAPEKVSVVPGCLDGDAYPPTGDKLELPRMAQSRFVFLSIFDWQCRKGWDILLKAYVREFALDDANTLLLKVSLSHGHPIDLVRRQTDEVLGQAGTSLAHRPDIVIWDDMLDADQMAALYRSVDAFVMPTRGEGWGRTYMEAMACGLPTIGTAASGNVDFMNDDNSRLIPAELVDVPEHAWREIPPFRGHKWYEPDEAALRRHMREVLDNPEAAQELGQRASRHIHDHFNIANGQAALEQAIERVETQLVPRQLPPPRDDQLRVELHGDLLANHSFANINETLTDHLGRDDEIALSVRPRFIPQGAIEQRNARTARLKPFIDRPLDSPTQVTIRHAFPPDWSAVPHGKWVHIQPWEFGHLPTAWLEPLREQVDEIWAPSHYVKRVYEQSGISPDKIHVIPWGIDPDTFQSAAPPRHLPTAKTFRFFFVGGAIPRKGFDILLEAYLAEFSPGDDVCLVVKDMGVNTVYRYGHCREKLHAARQQADNPEIVYFDDDMTPGQLASLYTACDCLVLPYRGEGFGLPILEGMACGLAPIVTAGGPSDDFVSDDLGVRLPSRQVSVDHPEPLCGPATELEVSVADLRRALRDAYENQQQMRDMGARAAEHVLQNYTWRQSAERMKQRMEELVRGPAAAPTSPARIDASHGRLPVTAVVTAHNDDDKMGDCLARIAPFAGQLIVADGGSVDQTAVIAGEYGAEVITLAGQTATSLPAPLRDRVREGHIAWFEATDKLVESDWDGIREALIQSHRTLQLSTGKTLELTPTPGSEPSASSTSSAKSPAIAEYMARFHPFLNRRAETFRQILQYLDGLPIESPVIIETGCIRMADDWGAGQSTLIFDAYARHTGARFTSVDSNAASCHFARENCTSSTTTIVQEDSVAFLSRYAAEHPASIDLLYLDSFDLDWNAPHASALHHLQELCAARPALKPGALVVVDDHRDETGRPGKSAYVAGQMQSINASVLFANYQIGWIV